MALLAEDVWSIVRAWAEGVPFDFSLAAKRGRWEAVTVRNKARSQGWTVAEAGRIKPAYDQARLQRVRNVLWHHLAVLADQSPDDPAVKIDIDALQLQMRALDMLEKGIASQEQEEEGSDIAETLARINDRIIELAREFAREIAAGGAK